MRQSGNLVGAAMLELDSHSSRMELASLIGRMATTDRPEGGWSLPPGADAHSFLEHLVHQSALQVDQDGRLRCRIPSFRSFLIDEGMTPGVTLLDAASRGDERRAERALASGAGVGFRGRREVTPLHVAVGCGRTGILRLLLDRGADPAAKDCGGRTPADTARRYGKDECAGILDAAAPPPGPDWDDGPGFDWWRRRPRSIVDGIRLTGKPSPRRCKRIPLKGGQSFLRRDRFPEHYGLESVCRRPGIIHPPARRPEFNSHRAAPRLAAGGRVPSHGSFLVRSISDTGTAPLGEVIRISGQTLTALPTFPPAGFRSGYHCRAFLEAGEISAAKPTVFCASS